MTIYRGFMLWPDGRIEEVKADGGARTHDRAPGLFDDLVESGYPLFGHPDFGDWDGILNLNVEGGRVFAHTHGSKSWRHDMGAASELFLAWFRKNAEQ